MWPTRANDYRDLMISVTTDLRTLADARQALGPRELMVISQTSDNRRRSTVSLRQRFSAPDSL